MSSAIESLKAWSHFLFWCAVVFPLIGVIAGIARYYVDRTEKALSSAAAKAVLDESRRELETLKAQAAPRKLSEEQMKSIAVRLKEYAGTEVAIISMNGSSEVTSFSRALAATFRAADWSVQDPSTAIGGISGAGVFVVPRNGTADFDNLAKKVLDALSSSGVAARIAPGPEAGPMAGTNTAPLTLYVGDKP